MSAKPDNSERDAAIARINHHPDRVLISLVRSQTIDLFAGNLSDDLKGTLEKIRQRAPDAVKVAVDSISRTPKDDGYEVVLDLAGKETLSISDKDAGPFTRTLGGGLCNLSKDLEIILDVFQDKGVGGRKAKRQRIDYLTWEDAADTFPGTIVPGRSRSSLIFRGEGFEKLILTERGPTFDTDDIDLWRSEHDFLGNGDDFIFIGQEPADSKKFDLIMERKLKNKGLKVFWLVGGNQLKKLYTEYRHFLSIADVVSLNLAEAAQFFGFEPLRRKHKDASELRVMYAREISRRVLEDGANHVLITDGAKGASLARKARGGRVEFVYSPLIQENSIEVDPNVREDTGCGDSFAAAVAAHYLAFGPSLKLNQAANFAHYIAGIIFQRPRPNLTDEDRGFVEFAFNKAKESGAFVGKHEIFERDDCQIRPAPVPYKGGRRNVLVLILGGDPSDPEHPRITGAAAAMGNLARICQDGSYALAPLVRVVPRLSTHPEANRQPDFRPVTEAEMNRLVKKGLFCKEIGGFDADTPFRHGVLTEDLKDFEGVCVLRVTLLEALEILSSENFAELFSDIKYWHFPTEEVDERLVWHTKTWGVSREQSREIICQTLRDYVVRALSPQFRFSRIRATNREGFEREMTDQLILRLDALLVGLFRGYS